MRLKLMMALTDLKACVCLPAFLQVQLSTLLKFICDCYATHIINDLITIKHLEVKKQFESLTLVNKCDLTCFGDNRQQNNKNAAMRHCYNAAALLGRTTDVILHITCNH